MPFVARKDGRVLKRGDNISDYFANLSSAQRKNHRGPIPRTEFDSVVNTTQISVKEDGRIITVNASVYNVKIDK